MRRIFNSNLVTVWRDLSNRTKMSLVAV